MRAETTLILLLAAVAAGGCFDVPKPDVAFLCGAANACPDDYECRADGCCHRVGSTGGVCAADAIDAAASDAPENPPDAAAGSPDAALVIFDAAPPDAEVDAAQPALVDLTPDPASVGVAGTVQMTVTIAPAAGAGGVVIALMSDNEAIATVPAMVTVPQGQTTANFDATGVAMGSAMISASFGVDIQTATINVN